MNEDPVRVTVGTLNGATKTIKQKLVYVGQEEGKLMAIRQMLAKGVEPPVIIFTETIDRAQELFRELVQHGINADIIHSSRSQTDRERVITQFRNGRIWFLITTELLARGLDFPAVSCVINYDFPLSTASYIHRIGRTGRAGKRGKAITFFTREDADALRIVANVMRQSGCEVPEWMLQLDRKKTKDILYNRKRKAREEDMIPQ
jgi:ATP-dependent RNA helicase DDX52/ROK1